MAVADASLRTLMDSMSRGLMVSMADADSSGIPSTTNKGELLAVNDRFPLILMEPTVPGR